MQSKNKTQRILAVDDIAANLAILEELLDDEYDVVYCESGEQALEAAIEFRPDLVLLDIMMPGIDGYETCRRMREHQELACTKIIMVSAKTQLEDRLRGYEVGANDYVSKPFDHNELRAKIDVYLQLKTVEEVNIAKTRVIEVLQHSGRTPLTPIIGNAQLLAMETAPPDEMRVVLAESILRSGQRLLNVFAQAEHWIELVSDALEMRYASVSLNDLIDDAIQDLEGETVKKNVTINVSSEIADDIRGDADELRFIIDSLLKNAIRFSPEDGVVSVNTRSDNGFTLIEVADQGEGFARETLDQNFLPFANPAAVLHNQGNGMSLAICSEIARYHEGSLTKHNQESGGALVSLRLPMNATLENAAPATSLEDFADLNFDCTL